MKIIDVNTIVKKDNNVIKRFSKYFNTDEPLTVNHIKNVIKGELGLPFEIVKEEFYYMDKILKDADTAPFKSGNELILIVK